jgi:hypothetical protein
LCSEHEHRERPQRAAAVCSHGVSWQGARASHWQSVRVGRAASTLASTSAGWLEDKKEVAVEEDTAADKLSRLASGLVLWCSATARASDMASQARQRVVGGASSVPASSVVSKDTETSTREARGWKSRLIVVHLTGDEHFDFVLTWAMTLVVVCLCAELSGSTAYGRFGEGAYVSLNPRLGWWLMELPVTITFLYFFFVKGGPQSHKLVPRLFALHMAWHYAYRGWL